MKEIVQWIKKVGLFLTGVILVVWGFKVNAANNTKAKQAEKAEKADNAKKKKPSSLFGSVKTENKKDSTQTTTHKKDTVIETDKKPEKSSGTE